MKLLLTSNGLSNNSIAEAFQNLVGKKPEDTRVALIPTAANPERSNKDWLIDDLYNIRSRGYYVDIIELTAHSPKDLEEVLMDFDAIFVGGGNTFYLSYWLQKSGLFELLPRLLETKVYAGISAGSMVAGQSLVLSSQAQSNLVAFNDGAYDLIGPKGQSSGETLGFVDFIFRPHLNSRFFTLARADVLREKAKGLDWEVYALDDNSAIKISDDNIEIISEGEWIKLEKS